MRSIKLFTKNFTQSSRTRMALLAALALAGAGAVGVALAQAGGQEKPPYHSSVQVPDTGDEGDEADSDEGREEDEKNAQAGEAEETDATEAARFQHLSRITADQARASALAKVPGTAGKVALENEDGNLVYGVTVRTATGEQDVKVDAGNARVLHVERDERD